MAWLFRDACHAQLYHKYRPVYPRCLYDTIVSFLRQRPGSIDVPLKTAIDIGCGPGQSTIPLCPHFETVIGVDASEAQIAEAKAGNVDSAAGKVAYHVAQADNLTFQSDNSVDLVTVAQALHWFHSDRFYTEVKRVLHQDGVLAAYGYGFMTLQSKEAQALVEHFYTDVVNSYWEKGRRHIENHYSSIFTDFALAFPDSVRIDTMQIIQPYTVHSMIGYISSWSAYQKYSRDNPHSDALQQLTNKLTSVYDDIGPDHTIDVTYPIFLLLGRKS